jgi:hypothetical protein
MDWDAWARKTEKALDVAGRGDWRGLFAPDATFSDPNTPSTTDVRKISRDTRAIFPDWTQEITSIRGGDDWAVFEWIGRGTFTPPGQTVGRPMQMDGVTLVDVDGQGLVTKWRDYFDMKSVEDQLRREPAG